jgi:hypothetical protein
MELFIGVFVTAILIWFFMGIRKQKNIMSNPFIKIGAGLKYLLPISLMASCLFTTTAMSQDYTTQFNKLMQSARTGNANAQFNLGLMYAKGQGVKVDFVRAKMWVNLSAVNSEGAANEANRTEAMMLGLQISLNMSKEEKELSNKYGTQCLLSSYKQCP